MILDYKSIINGYTKDVPVCVISYILKCYGINLDVYKNNTKNNLLKIRKFLSITNITVNYSNPTKKDYGIIARWVNPNSSVNWELKKLKKAFSHILSFNKIDNFCELKHNFIFHELDNIHTNTINIIIVYAALKYFKINIKSNYTSEIMVNVLRKYLLYDKIKLRSNILNMLNIHSYDKNILYNIYLKLHKEEIIDKIEVTFKTLKNSFGDSTIKDTSDIVCYFVKNYKYSIVHENDIIKEYTLYKNCNDFEEYLSKTLINVDDTYYLYIHFDKIFPEEYYTESELSTLSHREGYTDEILMNNSNYELLSNGDIENTFFHGKFNCITNKTTYLYLQDVKEENSMNIVCYGILREKLVAYTIQELLDTFKAKFRLVTPDGIILTKKSISKLLFISEDIQNGNETQKQYLLRQELKTIISSLQADELNGGYRKLFMEKMDKTKSKKKKLFVKIFIKILNLGMYMRSWKGPPDPYPLKFRNPTEDIWDNVIPCWNEINDMVKGIKIIEEIPIIKYDGEIIYENYKGKKQTLKKRLHIVRFEKDNVNACVRVASNWFLCTSCIYLEILNSPCSFTLNDINYFS